MVFICKKNRMREKVIVDPEEGNLYEVHHIRKGVLIGRVKALTDNNVRLVTPEGEAVFKVKHCNFYRYKGGSQICQI